MPMENSNDTSRDRTTAQQLNHGATAVPSRGIRSEKMRVCKLLSRICDDTHRISDGQSIKNVTEHGL